MKPPETKLAVADWLVLVIALTLPTAITWLYFVALDGADKRLQQGAYTIGKAIQFALPVLWLVLIRKQVPQWPRLTSRGLMLGLFLGLAIGGGMLALYFFVLKPAESFAGPADAVRLKMQSIGVQSVAAFAAMGIFYSVLHSLLEEYYWRWFVYSQLCRRWTLPLALGVAGIAFASHHVLVVAHYFGWLSPLTWLCSASVAIGGVLWGLLYERTRSLYAPWLSHALVDAAIFIIGYDIIA